MLRAALPGETDGDDGADADDNDEDDDGRRRRVGPRVHVERRRRRRVALRVALPQHAVHCATRSFFFLFFHSPFTTRNIYLLISVPCGERFSFSLGYKVDR